MAWWLVAFAALLLIGTLTREMTGLLLWFSFLCLHPRRWRWGLGLGLLFAGLLLTLRLVLHAAGHPFSIAAVWAMNTTPWRLRNLLTYGSLFLLVLFWCYRPPAQRLHRRLLWVVLPYLALTLALGAWQELRLWMPLFLLSIPFLRQAPDARP